MNVIQHVCRQMIYAVPASEFRDLDPSPASQMGRGRSDKGQAKVPYIARGTIQYKLLLEYPIYLTL